MVRISGYRTCSNSRGDTVAPVPLQNAIARLLHRSTISTVIIEGFASPSEDVVSCYRRWFSGAPNLRTLEIRNASVGMYRRPTREDIVQHPKIKLRNLNFEFPQDPSGAFTPIYLLPQSPFNLSELERLSVALDVRSAEYLSRILENCRSSLQNLTLNVQWWPTSFTEGLLFIMLVSLS